MYNEMNEGFQIIIILKRSRQVKIFRSVDIQSKLCNLQFFFEGTLTTLRKALTVFEIRSFFVRFVNTCHLIFRLIGLDLPK